jgi:hypothetical protein
MSTVQHRRVHRAFTLIEVIFAAALLTVVGMAIIGFLTAFARGSEMRSRISDPAIESTLATRRLASVAPGFCYTLTTNGDHALVWLSDTVPSRTVHLSEAGIVRFDAANRELVFESVNPTSFAADLTLEEEFLEAQYPALVTTFDVLRGEGRLVRHILAEGLDEATIAPANGAPGFAVLTVSVNGVQAAVRLSPAILEEPLR